MKFIQPVEITAEYKITTPMFLGGAFPTEGIDAQQFRNASLKGALRFWWRALNWGRVLKANHGDEAAALKALHQREGELFGRASDGKDSVQSRVQLSTALQESKIIDPGSQPQNLVYLLGQGLYSHNDRGPAGRKGTQRPYVSDGSLTVRAHFKHAASADDTSSVAEALTALGLFGGLGSRARKGFGSLAIQSLETPAGRCEFNDLATIQSFIEGLDFSAPENAPLTALSTISRIDVSLAGSSPILLLEAIGKEQQLYRSFGKDGKVGTEEARRNFVDDHDNARDAANGTHIKQLPRRAVFGLPHNYHFSSGGDLNIAPSGEGRRTSPLLIHIHQFPNGQSLAVQMLLPARFLPEKTVIELKNPKKKNQKPQSLAYYSVNYQVIHDYLDGFKQRKVLRHGK